MPFQSCGLIIKNERVLFEQRVLAYLLSLHYMVGMVTPFSRRQCSRRIPSKVPPQCPSSFPHRVSFYHTDGPHSPGSGSRYSPRLSFYHGPQRFGIFQHGAGTQHVFIEGLVVVVRHEDGTLEGVQQAGIVDVAVGVVDEYAGLHIALGVDVQIVSSAGDASAYIFRIVLEIHGEDGFALTEFPNPVVYLFPLLRGGQ